MGVGARLKHNRMPIVPKLQAYLSFGAIRSVLLHLLGIGFD